MTGRRVGFRRWARVRVVTIALVAGAVGVTGDDRDSAPGRRGKCDRRLRDRLRDEFQGHGEVRLGLGGARKAGDLEGDLNTRLRGVRQADGEVERLGSATQRAREPRLGRVRVVEGRVPRQLRGVCGCPRMVLREDPHPCRVEVHLELLVTGLRQEPAPRRLDRRRFLTGAARNPEAGDQDRGQPERGKSTSSWRTCGHGAFLSCVDNRSGVPGMGGPATVGHEARRIE